MWTNVLLLCISAALLAYWFRYTCLLILSARKTRDFACAVAEANELRFPEIQRMLSGADVEDTVHLDVLHRALDRDYRLLTFLFRHGAEFRILGRNVENRMLMIDFHLMRVWYAVWRRASARRGRVALEEMLNIVRHFADVIGESAAA